MTQIRTSELSGAAKGYSIDRTKNNDIIVTRHEDGGAALYSQNSPLVAEVMAWYFLDELLKGEQYENTNHD